MNENASPSTAAPSNIRVGGVGLRAVALIVDSLIVFLVAGIPIAIASGSADAGGSDGSYSADFELGTGGSLLLGLVQLAYFTVCESTWGTTIGKRMLDLRVRTEDGEKPSLTAALVRNVLRVVDGLPYLIPYLLGAIVAWTSPRRQRIGDRAAHTVVLKG